MRARGVAAGAGAVVFFWVLLRDISTPVVVGPAVQLRPAGLRRAAMGSRGQAPWLCGAERTLEEYCLTWTLLAPMGACVLASILPIAH
ncbi:hypothetical protein GCM10011394_11190 [Luteimonas terricola]|uniref:Uncharacterized protein n=1 Tax=Luteimonas terricola TaxID=645597 RepID=A0ABQ2EDY4_9GAMM|nr:hypothetical protein GCM10011394_11190 [Luteimonas terricola]